jgi:hypothetical protein
MLRILNRVLAVTFSVSLGEKNLRLQTKTSVCTSSAEYLPGSD